MPLEPRDKVWVAQFSQEGMESDLQVCASRYLGITWLVGKIPLFAWETFYDSLAEDDRDDLTRTTMGMEPDHILDTWLGRDDVSDTHTIWGDETRSMVLREQEVLA